VGEGESVADSMTADTEEDWTGQREKERERERERERETV